MSKKLNITGKRYRCISTEEAEKLGWDGMVEIGAIYKEVKDTNLIVLNKDLEYEDKMLAIEYRPGMKAIVRKDHFKLLVKQAKK